MNNPKILKTAGLMAAVALVFVGAAAVTAAHLTGAQSTTPASPRNGTIAMPGMMHRFGKGISGTVSSISGNTIMLAGNNGTGYTVNASGASVVRFSNGVKTTMTVADIKTGDTIEVMGTVSGTTVTAKNIIDGAFPTPPQAAASGTVSAINGNSFTLTGSNGTTYTVDASNVQIDIDKSGVSLQNSGVQTGDTLSVFGTVNGSNITATRISDGIKMGRFGAMPWK